ncbi:hypothetical protein Q5L94_09555 [Idiomarina sp. Sol25]|uniref:hypothetical protein n=1 Tax=Idiomarina sp. Sol25 TaxID=3064000 RepID=UPI00294B8088|nr:hypothetical protein [Idiomarina sp. Sol25]MDV6328307.1 hypothetical protein [Idiomarina sp. Sol25]
MNKIACLVFILLFPVWGYASDLIHPLDFNGTESEKSKVIAQIKANVKRTYTEIGMGDPLTLRMMEKEELASFKNLTKVKDRRLLDSVIRQYCDIGMCNYNTILMMYNEQSRASKEELSW